MKDLEKHFKSLAKNDLSAFDLIYEKTYQTLYLTVFIILKDDSLSKDIVQDTYMTLLKKIKAMEHFNFPLAFLIKIARNLAINCFNRRQKEIHYDLQDPTTHCQFETEETPKELIDESNIVHIAKKILPDDEFTILLLCAVNDLKRREVSEILSLPIGTVTWKYNNAISKMKNYLKGDDGNEEKRSTETI